MKKLIIQWATILLSFFIGIVFMSYMTRMGNHDMTGVMAEAGLPVLYVEKEGQLYNEIHGYVEEMDGSYMKDSIIGVSEDHVLGLALKKYNARIEEISYQVRSLDMSRLIENGENLKAEDDGSYLHLRLNLKDLLNIGEDYLFLLQLKTDDYENIYFYSVLNYLGENHVQECVDFALNFHAMTLEKNHTQLASYLEPNTSMDGNDLGYVNIHSRTGPVTWGDMLIERISDIGIRFTGLDGDTISLEFSYQVKNTETEEIYNVVEAFRTRYTSVRMYLLAYERKMERVFEAGKQLVKEDGSIALGIQGDGVNYLKNEEENVLAFVQQGQLWSYDFGQNRLSCVYGFQDGDDKRGLYNEHDFRLLCVEDSGSMDFLVYGYMNRGLYEGRSGVLFCHYDALLNTVEEEFFLPSNRPYQVLKEEIGALAVQNQDGKAWISYQENILEIDLVDCSFEILAQGIGEEQLKVSEDGNLAAWTQTKSESEEISLLNVETGKIKKISSENGEILKVLGFMDEDFIYGVVSPQDIRSDVVEEAIVPMYRIMIENSEGEKVREFNYASKGKYVTEVSIVENRIDLSCVQLSADGSYVEALPEPITYSSEIISEKLALKVISDESKRNEYHFVYTGKLKNGSMKRPQIKQVLFENNRNIEVEQSKETAYFAYSFHGEVQRFEKLSDAIRYAYEHMGSVWMDGSLCCWERGNYKIRTQLAGFENLETLELQGDSISQCLQLLLKQHQIYMNVQSSLDAGLSIAEICKKELGDKACLLSGCSLDMIIYYISHGAPVMGLTEDGKAVLIVGYDSLNIIYYEAGQTTLKKAGRKDSTAMFERAGNYFFTYLP